MALRGGVSRVGCLKGFQSRGHLLTEAGNVLLQGNCLLLSLPCLLLHSACQLWPFLQST